MARTTIVTLEDDIDGGPATETIAFSLDGVDYEIDLNEANAQALRSVLEVWTGAARKAGSSRRNRSARPGSHSGRQTRDGRSRVEVDPVEVRTWASKNGLVVNPRGRLSKNLVAQFREAGK
jgi:hypothetical protein